MFVNYNTDLNRKIFKYWEAVKLTVVDTFSKILIFTWNKLKFHHQQQ